MQLANTTENNGIFSILMIESLFFFFIFRDHRKKKTKSRFFFKRDTVTPALGKKGTFYEL